MPVGRPIPSLTLTSEEKQTLERWSRRHSLAQALALPSRIVLACAEGLSNTAVARRLPATMQTVGKWRSRFLAQRLDGLLEPTSERQSPYVKTEVHGRAAPSGRLIPRFQTRETRSCNLLRPCAGAT